MINITKNINDFIFGDIPTSEFIEESHQNKIELFGKAITYSLIVFMSLITMCRDKCAYCTFVKYPNDGG